MHYNYGIKRLPIVLTVCCLLVVSLVFGVTRFAPETQAYAADASQTTSKTTVKGTILKQQGKKTYPIVYVLNGGKQAKKQVKKIKSGNTVKVSKLKKPTRKGFKFVAWYKNAKLTKKATKLKGASKASKRTVYAKWKAIKYTITYKTNGGKMKGSYSKTYTVLKAATLPIPTKAGYQFDGWYLDKALTKRTVMPAGTTGNKTLYAKWSPLSFSIAYVLNGGSFTGNAVTMYSGSSDLALPTPVKKGYAFLGWGLDANYTKVRNTLVAGTKGNQLLYAKWRKREVVAHRGLRGNAPENSIEAFEAAKDKGFKIVETDVRFTSDNVAVLWHGIKKDENSSSDYIAFVEKKNETDDETETKYYTIEELKYEQLRDATLDETKNKKSGMDGRNVATFDECMEECANMNIGVRAHIKDADDRQLLDLVTKAEQNGMQDRMQWFSNKIGILQFIKSIDPDATFVYSQPISKTSVYNAMTLEGDGAEVMSYYTLSSFTTAKYNLCKEVGMPLATWVNEGASNEVTAGNLNPYICSALIDTVSGSKVPDLIGS